MELDVKIINSVSRMSLKFVNSNDEKAFFKSFLDAKESPEYIIFKVIANDFELLETEVYDVDETYGCTEHDEIVIDCNACLEKSVNTVFNHVGDRKVDKR